MLKNIEDVVVGAIAGVLIEHRNINLEVKRSWQQSYGAEISALVAAALKQGRSPL